MASLLAVMILSLLSEDVMTSPPDDVLPLVAMGSAEVASVSIETIVEDITAGVVMDT